jgi:hypothetical protein
MKVFSKFRLALRSVHGQDDLNYLRFKLIMAENANNIANPHE